MQAIKFSGDMYAFNMDHHTWRKFPKRVRFNPKQPNNFNPFVPHYPFRTRGRESRREISTRQRLSGTKLLFSAEEVMFSLLFSPQTTSTQMKCSITI